MKEKNSSIIIIYISLIIAIINLSISILILNKNTNINLKTPTIICNQNENIKETKEVKEVYKEVINNNYIKNNYIYKTIEKESEPILLKEEPKEEPKEEIDINKKLLDLLNNYRIQNNLPEFIQNDDLTEGSKIRSKELVQNMTHIRPDDSWYETVITKDYTAAGEIIYRNNGDIENAFNSIINDKMNDEILLSEIFSNIGLNIYIDLTNNIYYYSLIFTN